MIYMAKKIKGIPNSESIQITFKRGNGDTFITTRNVRTGVWYMYKEMDGAAKKLGQANDPTKLDEKFIK